jgi:DNA-binding CsgD family transcriptional regulator
LVNLSWNRMMRCAHAACLETIVRGLAFTERHELRAYEQYLIGMRAWCRMEGGDWASAEEDARGVVAVFEAQPNISGHLGLIVVGRLGARRGDPAAGEVLDEAWRWAVRAEEPQRVGPAGVACAELAWLDGDTEAVERFARAALEAALPTGEPWFGGEAAFWLWRVGALEESPYDIEDAYQRSIAGDWEGAAAAWEALGCPYHAAEARWHADDEAAQAAALETFDRLGAERAAARLRSELRGRGARAVPRGPRRATREAPHGLTARQLEVLVLLAEGATNAQIAERLVLSTRTVDHPVAAILGKLGVASRREAASVVHGLVGGAAKGGQPGA